MSLTSSLLPLLLLSFLPSSSPLFHPCPHLTPFSSLFPPFFCCVYMAMKDAAFFPTLLRFELCKVTHVIFSPFLPIAVDKANNWGAAWHVFSLPLARTNGQGGSAGRYFNEYCIPFKRVSLYLILYLSFHSVPPLRWYFSFEPCKL